MSVRVINKSILKYVLEIAVIAVLVIVTFVGFNDDDVKLYASLAKSYDTKYIDAEADFVENTNDNVYVLDDLNRLTTGKLYVKNPNKVNIVSNVKVKVEKKGNFKVDNLIIKVNGKENITNCTIDDNYYIYDLGNITLKPYEEKKLNIGIYTADKVASIKYIFEVNSKEA